MKRRTQQWLFTLATLGDLAVYLFSLPGPGRWQFKLGIYLFGVVVLIVWLVVVQVTNKHRMQALWALADDLGYGPGRLKRLAGRYTLLDWAASRPERLQFCPRAHVWARVMRLLQAEQQRRSGLSEATVIGLHG